MLKLWNAEPNHEELFAERYEVLLGWALRLTERDHQRAEDLVHDTFVQFVLSRPDLSAIENLDGYLYVALKNAQLSHARRAAHDPQRNLTLLDYDSLEVTFRTIEPTASVQVQNELRLICRYACERKESSKAGSVLLLRFFLGYYPSEIAQVLLSTRAIVARWLQVARAEARLYVEDPGALTFMSNHHPLDIEPDSRLLETTDLIRQLIDTTHRSKRGACLSPAHLKRMYSAKAQNGIDCATLAHVVTCETCLDEVNAILGLPPLAERYPTDTIDRDKGSRTGGAGGGSIRDKLRRGRRRIKETLEHRPKELRVAANGYIVGSQKVASDVSEQEITLNLTEPISFVEVFSEQRLKLLTFNVTPPPSGPFDQETSVALSDDRLIEASIKFTGSWPKLRIVYRDPYFDELESADQFQEIDIVHESAQEAITRRSNRAKEILERIFKSLTDKHVLLRPETITAILAMILIAAVVFFSLRSPRNSLSANELLRRSIVAETSTAGRTDQVFHRTINLEERKVAGGELISKRRIEVWQSAQRGITARRLYDEKGQLIAGDWRRGDDVQTLYHHGARPQLQIRHSKSEIRNFDEVWLLDPTAKDFLDLIPNQQGAQLEETVSRYWITYTSNDTAALRRATLLLNRDDLHAVEQVLTFSVGGEEREFRFTEVSFERRTPASVAPAVFEPEPELLGDAARRGDAPTVSVFPSRRVSVSPVVATAELEVEVLRLLNQIGADLNDQTTVTRTLDGKLRIGGVVDSNQRKQQILRSLESVVGHPAVQIQIETVEEAIRRQTNRQTSSSTITTERAEIAEQRIPVYEDLQKYFGKQGSEADQQIGQFATRILGQSREAMSRAAAMRRLAQRFSEEDLRTMSPEARAKWLSVIRSHARAFEHETRMMRQALQPIFYPQGSLASTQLEIEITNDASLVRAVQRLFDLGAANDNALRSAFAISREGKSTSAMGSAQFWHSLFSAEKLAAEIGKK